MAKLEFDGRRNAERRAALWDNGGRARVDPAGSELVFRPVRKRSVTFVLQIAEPFDVLTNEGPMEGAAGDWLAIGVAGEMYPIANDVFAESYERADGA